MTQRNHIMNEYAFMISEELYDRTPKAVFAAIAVSFLVNMFDAADIDDAIVKEWGLLNANGIVAQVPPLAKERLGALIERAKSNDKGQQ